MSVMDVPSYTLQIAFNTTTTPTWTTIANLRAFAVKRGRQDELSDIQAGELTILVGNPTGDLSPDNASGAHYPNVKVMRRIRLRATYSAVTYDLFMGYIESIVPQDNTVVDSDVVIVAKDFFKQLTQAKLTTSFAAQDEQTRIGAVLDAVGTPGLTRTLDAGLETLLASTLSKTAALQHIQDVLTGERGIFFVAGNGALVFHNRHHRFVNSSGYTSQATFGQSSGLAFVAMDYVYDDQNLYNEVVVEATGTSEGPQTASDSTSQTAYGLRTLAVNAPTLPTGQAATLAAWLLYCYKDSRGRVRSLLLDADADTTNLYPQQLGREIGDRITVIRNNPGSLGISRDMWIEGIDHTYDAAGGAGLLTRWLLSDIGVGGPTPFRLGISALNSGDVLIY